MNEKLFQQRIDCLHNIETCKALQAERVTLFSCTFIVKPLKIAPVLRHLTAVSDGGIFFEQIADILKRSLAEMEAVLNAQYIDINNNINETK